MTATNVSLDPCSVQTAALSGVSVEGDIDGVGRQTIPSTTLADWRTVSLAHLRAGPEESRAVLSAEAYAHV
ncbi:hypothetical protein H3221_010735 [Pseudomonas sp. LMG 31766]|uniref:Uncharacterized protein n=1 Tax=Pseudomonas chaetocerotis TaxID=2758695 RepID=A0A931GBM4_9PSED|nr:hypothetical protein [Pseudomonas chaetocerotis]MBZ9665227.1 hypothetical protein [Pseudomonas chaetocerotis]